MKSSSQCVRVCTENDPPRIGRKKPSMPFMSDRPVFTYQTRPALADGQAAVLDAYAELYGRAERSLFAAMQAGRKNKNIQSDFFFRVWITARPHNAVRVWLGGKKPSIKKRRARIIVEKEK